MTTPAGPGSPAPVIIVGAGPTGLVAALLLARYGVRTLVLERHPVPYPLPRAVHLDDEAVRILQAVGLADAFAGISRPASGLRLLSAGHQVIAEFRRDGRPGIHGHPRANLFDQPDLDRLLLAEVARRSLVELRPGVEVLAVRPDPPVPVAGGPPPVVRVRCRPVAGGPPTELVAAAVLGCDGAASTVRGGIGAELVDLRFEERWLVLDVRLDRPPRGRVALADGVDQICDPHRAATAMRIGPDRYRWEFRLRPGERPDDLTAPAVLAALLEPWLGRAEEPDAPRVEVVRAAGYTFRARLADRWREGRVFLLGDAAHQTPPFVGQGLASGLRDAHNLAWKLARVLAGGDGPVADERLLDSYAAEREPQARASIRLAVRAGWAMTGGQDRAAAVRRGLLAILCRVPGAPGRVLDRAGPPLSPGAVVRPGRRRGPAGQPVPQPWVQVEGRPGTHRLDDVLGRRFALIADGPLDPGLADLARAVGARVVRLDPDLPAGTRDTDGRTTTVRSPALRAWLRAHRAGAVLVRPDRVVLAASPGPVVAGLRGGR